MWNSDGLPIWYVKTLENKELMNELKHDVMEYLENYSIESAETICSQLDISPVFKDEVEEIIEEYKGA